MLVMKMVEVLHFGIVSFLESLALSSFFFCHSYCYAFIFSSFWTLVLWDLLSITIPILISIHVLIPYDLYYDNVINDSLHVLVNFEFEPTSNILLTKVSSQQLSNIYHQTRLKILKAFRKFPRKKICLSIYP